MEQEHIRRQQRRRSLLPFDDRRPSTHMCGAVCLAARRAAGAPAARDAGGERGGGRGGPPPGPGQTGGWGSPPPSLRPPPLGALVSLHSPPLRFSRGPPPPALA